MNYFGGSAKLPRGDKITDKQGNILPEWRDALEKISGQGDASNLLTGAGSARLTADHLLANTSSVAWDQSTAGQPKPYVPASGIDTEKLADAAVTTDKIDPGAITTLTIADNSVTFAKIQQISTDTLLGRDTAGTGNVESISLTGGLEFSGSLSIRIADAGVTNAKLANMAQATIKGRASGAGTGVPVDLTSTQATAILDAATTSLNGVVMLATDAEVYAATSGANAVAAANLSSSAALVSLTDAATIAIDWSTFINGTVTITANRALGNPTNGQPGTWRTIYVDANSGTLRTLTFGANYFGDLPTLADITSSKAYLLSILCKTTSVFILKSTQAIP